MLEPLRNFESPTPLKTDVVVTQLATVPASRARLRWGVVGTLPAATTGGFKVLNCDDKYKEQAGTRINNPQVKITNPDDDTQYVIVESVGQLFFQHQSKDELTVSYVKQQVIFGPPQLQGALSPHINVLPGPNETQCKAEYDLIDPYGPIG